MSKFDKPQKLPEDASPADEWYARASKRLLDELFRFARQYRSGKAYHGLLKFVAGFRFYSPLRGAQILQGL